MPITIGQADYVTKCYMVYLANNLNNAVSDFVYKFLGRSRKRVWSAWYKRSIKWYLTAFTFTSSLYSFFFIIQASIHKMHYTNVITIQEKSDIIYLEKSTVGGVFAPVVAEKSSARSKPKAPAMIDVGNIRTYVL